MRIAVLSDTHDRLPSTLPRRLKGADEIWHLGDVCDPATLVALEQLGPPLRVVRGNCDAHPGWPLELTLERGGVVFHLTHIPPRRAPEGAIAQDTSVQAEADRHRKPAPPFVTDGKGRGTVESFTVIYGGKGEAQHGVVMLRTAENARALARVPVSDAATLARLTDMNRTPVGSSGEITTAADGMLEWRAAV